MSTLSGKRLIHVTTVDMSLVLLLGRQLQKFAAAGMEVIGVSAPGPYVAQLEEWGIQHVPLRHSTRSMAPSQDALLLTELWSLFRRLGPDIVHTHNPKPGLYGRVAARSAGVPVVVNTVHGLYAAPEDSLARRTVFYALERAASTCSGAELVQNPEDLDVLRRLKVPDHKLVLLGNGVDLERFHPPTDESDGRKARAELGIPPSAVVVGIVGRLVWEKGFRELFEAATQLSASRPDVVFVVVGASDPEKADSIPDDTRAQVSKNANVIFTGGRSDVEYLYASFDIFVLPSYREGFPRSAMEAAAAGLPIIATDIRGCRQVVEQGRNGLLVPLHDTDRLTSAIEELVDDPDLRRRMGLASRRKAEDEFNDQDVVDKVLAAYERLSSEATSSTKR